MYLSLFNESDQPEALVGVHCPAAEQVRIRWDTTCDGRPEQVGRLPIRPGGTVPAVAGEGDGTVPAYRLELAGLTRPVLAGTTVPVALTFERAGMVTVDVYVRPRVDRVPAPRAPCPPGAGTG
ncbi:copper(I)-binding protein [Crossiella equi]|uniref:Copper(I)-binding protein n=1 Tax=Crossiella equi TaxID=130796 RepID=A0ABS5AT12_9PSEU|nr:copper chaperone PCu(A)C [Crossiella equi]MBP2479571.1 copper(I)-binding protein [Crossiella equi]